jgi:hypothetical protein
VSVSVVVLLLAVVVVLVSVSAAVVVVVVVVASVWVSVLAALLVVAVVVVASVSASAVLRLRSIVDVVAALLQVASASALASASASVSASASASVSVELVVVLAVASLLLLLPLTPAVVAARRLAARVDLSPAVHTTPTSTAVPCGSLRQWRHVAARGRRPCDTPPDPPLFPVPTSPPPLPLASRHRPVEPPRTCRRRGTRSRRRGVQVGYRCVALGYRLCQRRVVVRLPSTLTQAPVLMLTLTLTPTLSWCPLAALRDAVATLWMLATARSQHAQQRRAHRRAASAW